MQLLWEIRNFTNIMELNIRNQTETQHSYLKWYIFDYLHYDSSKIKIDLCSLGQNKRKPEGHQDNEDQALNRYELL